MNLNWYHYLAQDRIGTNVDDTKDPNGPALVFYDVLEITDHMQETIAKFETLKNDSVTYYHYYRDYPSVHSNRTHPFKMRYTVYADTVAHLYDLNFAEPNMTSVEYEVNVNSHYLGPYTVNNSRNNSGYDAVRTLMFRTKEIKLTTEVSSFDFGYFYRSCVLWEISFIYHSPNNGPFRLDWQYDSVGQCPGNSAYPSAAEMRGLVFFWFLTLAILVLAVSHQTICTLDAIKETRWLIEVEKKRIRERGVLDEKEEEFRQAVLQHLAPEQLHNADDVIKGLQQHEKDRLAVIQSYPAARQQAEREDEGGGGVLRSRTSSVVQGVLSRSASFISMAQLKAEQRFPKLGRRQAYHVFSFRFMFILTAGNVFALMFALYNLGSGEDSLFAYQWTQKLFLGAAAFFLWIGLLRWFSGTHGSFIIVMTLRRGLPRVVMFCFGVMPVFFGYTLFGVAYFGNTTGRFSTVFDGMMTLFSILNGDIIRESYLDLCAIDFWVGQIYLYTFVCFFIYVVLSIFVVIMEHAYEFISLSDPKTQSETEEPKNEIERNREAAIQAMGGGAATPDFSVSRRKKKIGLDRNTNLSEPLLGGLLSTSSSINTGAPVAGSRFNYTRSNTYKRLYTKLESKDESSDDASVDSDASAEETPSNLAMASSSSSSSSSSFSSSSSSSSSASASSNSISSRKSSKIAVPAAEEGKDNKDKAEDKGKERVSSSTPPARASSSAPQIEVDAKAEVDSIALLPLTPRTHRPGSRDRPGALARSFAKAEQAVELLQFALAASSSSLSQELLAVVRKKFTDRSSQTDFDSDAEIATFVRSKLGDLMELQRLHFTDMARDMVDLLTVPSDAPDGSEQKTFKQ